MKKEIRSELKQAVKNTAISASPRRKSICLFQPVDVFKTENILSRLLRGICVAENITLADVELGLLDKLRRKKRSRKKLRSDMTNIGTAITKDAVTFNKVHELLTEILGKKIDISIHVTGQDGQEHTYRQRDIVNEMAYVINQPPKKGRVAQP